MKKTTRRKSKAARKYILKKRQSQNDKKKKEAFQMKYQDALILLKHTPDNIVQNADVYLKVDRNGLITLLSELMNNFYENEDGVSFVPLKMNINPSKTIPITQRIALEIDENAWRKQTK